MGDQEMRWNPSKTRVIGVVYSAHYNHPSLWWKKLVQKPHWWGLEPSMTKNSNIAPPAGDPSSRWSRSLPWTLKTLDDWIWWYLVVKTYKNYQKLWEMTENSEFSHDKWWCSIVFCMFNRGYLVIYFVRQRLNKCWQRSNICDNLAQ